MAGSLGCGLFALDAALLVGFCRTMDWAPALLAHLGLVAVAASPGFGVLEGRRAARLQLAVWMALLGPFGVLIGITLFLPRSDVMAKAEAAREAGRQGEHTLDAPTRLDALSDGLVDGRLRLAGGHSVRPLLDVMIEGSTGDRLEALGLVAKRYGPGLAPTLRRGLQDGDGSVRVLAATVMAKLRDGHTRQIGLLQDAAEATASGDAWRALGVARLAYAASGLLEPDRAAREMTDGQACLARAQGTAEPLDAAPGPGLVARGAMVDCLAG